MPRSPAKKRIIHPIVSDGKACRVIWLKPLIRGLRYEIISMFGAEDSFFNFCFEGGGKLRCGISTACFYPENTLASLEQVIETGAPVTELFISTDSELKDGYVSRVKDLITSSGIQVGSIHPFSSIIEGFYFASWYEGRMEDGIRLYRRFFEVCRELGADKLVYHGDHKRNEGTFPDDRYADNFRQVAAVGREYDVTLCHENVFYCRLGEPRRVKEIRPLFGEDANFTLDTKQVQRWGSTVEEMLDAMDGRIRNIHISDYNGGEDDCLPPGIGKFDFPGFISSLKARGFDGDLIIELYREGFRDLAELKNAMAYINSLL